MPFLATLQIDIMQVVNTLLGITGIIAFIFLYNREQKNKVDKDDLKDLKTYVDQQDRSLHHRIDRVEKKMSDDINKMGSQIQAIYEHLLGDKKWLRRLNHTQLFFY